jgi:MFS family permease
MWMLLIGLPVYVFQLTGSALATSSVFVVELVPGLLVGQLAGVLVDRWDRRWILVVGSLLQAMLLVPLLRSPRPNVLWIVLLVAAVEACLARLGASAKVAIVPGLVPADELANANSAIAISDNLARLVGSPLGGLVIEFLGLHGVVVVDAATFVVSASLSLSIRPATAGRTTPSAHPSLRAAWVDGIRTIRRTHPLPALIAIGALSQVAQGIFVVLFVLFVMFVLVVLHGGGGDVGLIRGMQAIGGIAGGVAIGALSRWLAPRALVGWGFLAFGLVSLVTWNAPMLTTAIGVYVGLFVIAGVPGVARMTGLTTILQSATPGTHLGRVVAASEAYRARSRQSACSPPALWPTSSAW